MAEAFIYALLDELDNIRYIGKSVNPERRFYYHLRDKSDTHKVRWISSMKKKNIIPKLKKLLLVSENNWEFFERRLINQIPNLTNTAPGGECGPSRKGSKMKPSTKNKLKCTFFQKGNVPYNKGRKGRPLNESIKAAKSRSRGPYLITKPNDEELITNNLKKFCREEGLRDGNMYNVLRGERKHCNGYKVRKI